MTTATLPHQSTAPPVTPFAKLAKAVPVTYTADQLAELTQVSLRQVWLLRDMGSLPAPFKLGRLVRWRVKDIDEWIEAGCPKPK